MTIIWHILRKIPQYLLQGFVAMIGILLFILLWAWIHHYYGELVLPEPITTFKTAIFILTEPTTQQHLLITIKRALTGFFIASILGMLLGTLSGLISPIAVLLRPLVTIFMGMPPIAWVVLSMIWFGMGDISIVFTLVLAISPIIFVGSMQGMLTLQKLYSELADAFAVPWSMRVTDIIFPHLFSYVFPSLITALGMSWKVVIMAELMSSGDGMGMLLSVANTQLDMTMALGLIMVVVGLLLSFEYLLMGPIKKEVEGWRHIND